MPGREFFSQNTTEKLSEDRHFTPKPFTNSTLENSTWGPCLDLGWMKNTPIFR